MYLSFKRLAFIFLAIFALLLMGVVAFRVFWTAPGDRCEQNGGWYDITNRTCATPIYIPDITGRQPGESRLEASERQAEELVELERQVTAQRAARDAAIRAERERVRQAQEAD